MQRNNDALVVLGILFFFNILAWIAVYDLSQPRFLEVTFFDVGQGDSIFIETPQGHQILIDGGPSSIILEKLAEEMPFWDRTIDLIILTHPEHDHLAGLLQVLERYKVDYILWTGIVRDTNENKEWRKLIEEEGAEIKIVQAGQEIRLGEGIYFDILNPFENLEGKEFKNSNNTSIISLLVFNQNSFLFTGDAYKSVEKKIIGADANLKTDVLKVGHHGSKTSTSEEFIEQILPKIAVISVGKSNRYGHPHQETLAILKEYGIRVLRTDEEGDIKIISDGANLKIK
ncbi:MBL fold metallo-hydrolase [Patescibacteria group bacterium]|nr:MBL fold metallo-hydrolase [Patescibacteria group bacterium]